MKLPVQEIVGKYRNNIYAVAFSICANAGDAEDVVQDTLLQYYMTLTHTNLEDEKMARLQKNLIVKKLIAADVICLVVIGGTEHPLPEDDMMEDFSDGSHSIAVDVDEETGCITLYYLDQAQDITDEFVDGYYRAYQSIT